MCLELDSYTTSPRYAAAAVKKLHTERVVQQMELLILDAQIAQLTNYMEIKQREEGRA